MAWFNEVDSSKKWRLGTRKLDASGNEYIYLTGAASTAAADWVTYDNDFLTTRTAANAKGPVAIAQAAVDATTKYGWYGICGTFLGNVATGADNANVWVTATAGRVDNTDVAVDTVTNAVQRTATASNLATFHITYPFCHNIVLN